MQNTQEGKNLLYLMAYILPIYVIGGNSFCSFH